MKKFALVLVLLVALTAVFAACTNNTEKTNASVRWRNEEFLFNISKTSLIDENVEHNGETFVVEPVANGYESLPETLDQLVPDDIDGTYKMTISVNESKKECTFTTVQTLYCQYSTELLQEYEIWNDLQRLVVASDNAENPFENHENLTTLKSVTTQTVTFKNDASQRPLSSATKVDGYYLGNIAQTISQYEVKTTYDWEKSVALVSVNNATAQENKLKVNSAVNFIDANQILLYARSLEKSTTKFQDRPTVQVYVPYENTAKMANFVFTYACKTLVKVADEDKFVNVNALGVLIDGRALFVQLNVPDSVNKTQALDSVTNAGAGNLDKFSLLRFRSGIIRYELADYAQLENGAAILDAIEVKAPAEEEE